MRTKLITEFSLSKSATVTRGSWNTMKKTQTDASRWIDRLALMEKYENRWRRMKKVVIVRGIKWMSVSCGGGAAGGMEGWRRADQSHKNRLGQRLALRWTDERTVIEASGNNPFVTAAPASSQPPAGCQVTSGALDSSCTVSRWFHC